MQSPTSVNVTADPLVVPDIEHTVDEVSSILIIRLLLLEPPDTVTVYGVPPT